MHGSGNARVHIDLPDGAYAGDVPLAAVMRGTYLGSLHRGVAVVADASGQLVLALGDVQQPAFLRSAAKPLQVIPAILSGGVDRFGLTERELAVLCASHNAEPRHMEAVLSVLEKIGVGEDALHCGVHPPLHEPTAAARLRAGIEPSPVCNNCSGAHAGMLVACRAMGWPLDSYERRDHPLQVMTFEIVAAFAGMKIEEIAYSTDNCRVPTFRLPLIRAAQAFARLSGGQGVSSDLALAAERVVQAMTAYPEMVGGDHRFDTDLMRAAEGAIVAKGGADGFQGLGIVPRRQGLAMKISDGNARAIPPAVMCILTWLKAITPEGLSQLVEYVETPVEGNQAGPVGLITPVFSLGGGV
jgi:L-asparaginase II